MEEEEKVYGEPGIQYQLDYDEFKKTTEYKSFLGHYKEGMPLPHIIRRSEEDVLMLNPSIAALLMCKEYKAYDYNGAGIFLNGNKYMESYIDGYTKGIEEFRRDYKAEHIAGPRSEGILRSLYDLYHHNGYKSREGWKRMETSVPLMMMDKTFRTYGYYAGLIAGLKELKRKYSAIFTEYGFDECKNAPVTEQQDDTNNVILETIIDYLEPLKEVFRNEKEYGIAVSELNAFFEGQETVIKQPVFVKKGAKTKLAKELGQLCKSLSTEGISLKYLQFLKSLFTVFREEDIDSKALVKTNLYKYCTDKKKT